MHCSPDLAARASTDALGGCPCAGCAVLPYFRAVCCNTHHTTAGQIKELGGCVKDYFRMPSKTRKTVRRALEECYNSLAVLQNYCSQNAVILHEVAHALHSRSDYWQWIVKTAEDPPQFMKVMEEIPKMRLQCCKHYAKVLEERTVITPQAAEDILRTKSKVFLPCCCLRMAFVFLTVCIAKFCGGH